ncbi:MAG: hypothetical protein Q8N88_01635 [Nanoarchaeota archaeon]|nr:hypothetical protein [Nanoarchaeota archaeon]
MVGPNDVSLLAYVKYLQKSGNMDEAKRYARIAKKLNPNPDEDAKKVIDSFDELDKY